MDKQQSSAFFCCFPSFPVSRPRESVQDPVPDYSSARDLPPYDGSELDPEKKSLEAARSLGVERNNFLLKLPVNLSINFVTTTPPRFEPPPYYPGLGKAKSFQSSNALKPKPLRLVRDSRKKSPPDFYSRSTKTLFQGVAYISIDNTPPTPRSTSFNMASNQAMPKVTPLPNGPRLPTGGVGGGMSTSQTKEELLADLRRQVNPLPAQPRPPQPASISVFHPVPPSHNRPEQGE